MIRDTLVQVADEFEEIEARNDYLVSENVKLRAQLTAAEKERDALREALDAATDFIKAQKAMADGKVVREYDHKKVRYEAALAATQQKEVE